MKVVFVTFILEPVAEGIIDILLFRFTPAQDLDQMPSGSWRHFVPSGFFNF
jgi:hypothetical protein